MKKIVALGIILALTACNQSTDTPASSEYWDQKMCTQPKYKHLDRCKEIEQDYSAAIIGIIGQM